MAFALAVSTPPAAGCLACREPHRTLPASLDGSFKLRAKLRTGIASLAARGPAAAAASRGGQSSDSQAAEKQLLVIVAAVLLNDEGQILLSRRPSGKTREGRCELPGALTRRRPRTLPCGRLQPSPGKRPLLLASGPWLDP